MFASVFWPAHGVFLGHLVPSAFKLGQPLSTSSYRWHYLATRLLMVKSNFSLGTRHQTACGDVTEIPTVIIGFQKRAYNA